MRRRGFERVQHRGGGLEVAVALREDRSPDLGERLGAEHDDGGQEFHRIAVLVLTGARELGPRLTAGGHIHRIIEVDLGVVVLKECHGRIDDRLDLLRRRILGVVILGAELQNRPVRAFQRAEISDLIDLSHRPVGRCLDREHRPRLLRVVQRRRPGGEVLAAGRRTGRTGGR